MKTEPLWDGAMLGWPSTKPGKQPIGICPDTLIREKVNGDNGGAIQGKHSSLAVLDESDGHVLCVAPTGAGKGRGVIMPTALGYTGSMIILDIKGEAARVTAKRRRAMGQKVYIIDPFKEIKKKGEGAAFNPLDIVSRSDPDGIEDAALMFVKMIAGGKGSAREPFWEDQADDLNAAILTHVMTKKLKRDRTLSAVYKIIMDANVDDVLEHLLSSGKVTSDYAFRNIAAYLNLPERETRPSVLATARQRMRTFSSKAARTATEKTSFSIDDLKRGMPITIYLVVPVSKLDSHKGLLRLWLSSLINIMTQRKKRPELSTMFLIDEIAQLGHMPELERVITLLRGFGMRAMIFLQSLSQLRKCYPDDNESIIANCGTIITFGHRSFILSQDMANVLGDKSADDLYDMDDCDAAVKMGKARTKVMRRADYLEDEIFQGHYSRNTMLGR